MIKRLIKIASELDMKGYHNEADMMDDIIEKVSEGEMEEVEEMEEGEDEEMEEGEDEEMDMHTCLEHCMNLPPEERVELICELVKSLHQ